MPNLTALLGLLLGLIALFVSPGAGVKLISVYLLLAGLLRLISAENAAVLPQAPRRAAARSVAEDSGEADLDDANDAGPKRPVDAYRTFTPEELAPKRAAKSRRRAADEETEEEAEE